MGDDTLDPMNEIERQHDLALIRAALEAAAVQAETLQAYRGRAIGRRIRALSEHEILRSVKP